MIMMKNMIVMVMSEGRPFSHVSLVEVLMNKFINFIGSYRAPR